MKIALTCPASLPATQFGGIMFLPIHLAKKLSKDGNTVTIYTSNLDFANNANTFNKNLSESEKIENFTIKRSHVWFSFFLFFVNPRMYNQMLNDDFDIIHAIGVRSFQAFIAALISKKKKIPLILSDQGGLTTHPDLTNGPFFKKILIKLQTPLIKFVINQSTKIIAANDYEKNIFLHFCDSSKITIVRNGIDLAELYKTNANFKETYGIIAEFILFLGRFHYVKGVDVLVKAFNLIKNDPLLSHIKLVIMGVDFGYEKTMVDLIDSLNLTEKIIFVKNPSRDIVISAYDQCKFLVLPSRWELSPLTPLEGFAFKKPVISTTAHGIPSTITNNENSLLVSSSNEAELGDAILKLIKNPELCAKLGNSGFNMVKTVANSDRMVDDTFSVYKDTIEKK